MAIGIADSHDGLYYSLQFCRFGFRLVFVFCDLCRETATQCSCRAGVYALHAVLAELYCVLISELRLDNGLESTSYKSKYALAYDLVACSYADTAEDALALVPLDILEVMLDEAVMLLALHSLNIDLVAVSRFDELAVEVCVASALEAALGFFNSFLF